MKLIGEHMEEWRSIKGFEGKYLISNFARVKTIPFYTNHTKGRRLVGERIRKVFVGRNGYPTVTLGGNNKTIHRIIATAFIPNPENKPQVNHINGIKTDNHISNLEWATSSENLKHAYNTGLKKCYYKGGHNSPARKSVVAMKDCVILEFESIRDLASFLACNLGTLYNKAMNKNFNYKGYTICV